MKERFYSIFILVPINQSFHFEKNYSFSVSLEMLIALVCQLEKLTCHIFDTSIKSLSLCFTLCLHRESCSSAEKHHRIVRGLILNIPKLCFEVSPEFWRIGNSQVARTFLQSGSEHKLTVTYHQNQRLNDPTSPLNFSEPRN